MKTRILAALALTVVAFPASAAPLPGFSVVAETEHFTFYSRGAEKVDARKAESYLGELKALLGVEVSGRAEYYRYSHPQEIAAGTGRYAQGVTFPAARQIHSVESFHAHEIVHLVASELGDPGTFFQEGLAVALGNKGKWNGKNVDALARKAAGRAPLTALVARFDEMDPEVGYPLAGSFVRRLIETHGIARVTEFFRACGRESRGAAFARTFGTTLEEAGREWAESL